MADVKSHQNQYIDLIFSGEEQKNPLESFGPIMRPHYILHYVMSGCGYVSINGKTHKITAGQCFLFYPNDYMRYWADQYTPWHYIWVDFQGEICDFLLKKTAFTHEQFISESCSLHKIYPLFYNALKAVEENDLQEIKNASLYAILAQLIKLFPSSFANEFAPNKLAADIFSHVNSYFMNESISIQELTQTFNISRSQLFRLFKTTYNASPMDYIISLRLEQAKKLLLSSDASVANVAKMIGFGDPLYFSRIFSKKVGVSPTEYRKMHGVKRESDSSLPPP